MSLESSLREGLKSAKYFAAFCWVSSILIILLIRSFPRPVETFEFMAIAFMFGLSLGATAGWDTVKVNVKKLLQTSETTEVKA